MTAQLGAEKIIFGNDLKVTQVYNLAKLTKVEVIDRLQLILEIFLRRASTKEAKLQTGLARLQYELARAKEKVRLARKGEQPGFHGLGKYDVDVFYESVGRQVHNIQKKLKAISKTRRLHRHRRRELGFSLVSLAGYTNSGKSTLFNALAKENVPADPGLFTTLSTTTRLTNLGKENTLLTDTVGFIDKLPLTLIEAFRSTLEETVFSDLILLVVDVSEPEDEVERKIDCCLDTIREIGATGIPILTVLNKIDLFSPERLEEKIAKVKPYTANTVPVSALYGTNLHRLREEMARLLERRVQSSFRIPANGESLSFLSWVFDNANVHDVTYGESKITVTFAALPQLADRIRSRVKELGGTFEDG